MPTSDAAPPFAKHARADVILRSCDNVQFHVTKHTLSIASPVFNDMFTLNAPLNDAAADELCDGLPVVRMSEDSTTLDVLLRWCYPVARPPLTSLDNTRCLLAATHKLDIHAFDDTIQDALQTHLMRDPMGMLGVVIPPRLSEYTRRAVLALPLSTVNSLKIEGLTDSTLITLI
ncbi:hypothetical protein FA95DRAFT_1506711 [Auriscalpium vulgare]|uniref:Uncharacterized protein n=1 Tax=Auriscalpium vulgare TaxID=40419 RepID=A0ACB8R1A4_9AGAM|nr:hypothetical protein FA95DRAFT_1506711 [Auriscalpium vulgare]